MDLATERFGTWAGVSFLDGAVLLRLDTTGTDDFTPGRRRRRVDEFTAAVAGDAASHAAIRRAPLAADVAASLGVPPGAEPAGDGALVTLPLPAAAAGRGFLAVVTAGEPPAAELEEFAARVGRAVSAAAVYEESATLADTLRGSLAPADLPAVPGVDLGGAYRPAQAASQIGGDFYDVTSLGGARWALSIGDVCGKGVDAAVLTGQVRQSLRTAGLIAADPAEVLALVNETLLRTDGDTYVTLTYGVLEPADGGSLRVRLALGGHPPPLLLRGDAVSTLVATGSLVGMLDEVRFDSVEVTLGEGDALVLYTDGLPEARGPRGMLDMYPVARILSDCAGLPAQTIVDRLMQLAIEHLEGWPHDDIALLTVRCTGGHLARL